MSKGLNRVQLLGHIGRPPEIRSTHGGVVVANFSIATEERYKQGNDWKERTEWHACVAFGRLAEILRDYAGKGSHVLVEGRQQTRDFLKDGVKHYRTEVVIGDLTLLDRRPQGGKPGQSRAEDETEQRGRSYDIGGASPNNYADQGITDEDIPF